MAITPTTTFHGPGPGNVFIPHQIRQSPGATRMMQVEFSRNPDDFRLNQYSQLVTDSATAGLYVELDTDEAVRIVNLQDFVWPDGNDAPDGQARKLRWRKFATTRRGFPFRLGRKARENASFDILGANARMTATQAMTARTLDAVTVITTAANWPTGNKAATVDALLSTTGASWISSSTSQNFIKKSINTVVEAIMLVTGGVIKPGDISLLIGPDIAHSMGETAEIIQYMVNHERAIEAGLMGTNAANAMYSLPPFLYGVRLLVEDAVRVSTREGVTQTRAFMFGNNAVFLSRAGNLTGGAEGIPTLTTLTGFIHEDMTVETEEDSWNRRTKGRVTEDTDFVLTSTISGYHIADITT